MTYSTDSIPDLTGTTAVVTGANGGPAALPRRVPTPSLDRAARF